MLIDVALEAPYETLLKPLSFCSAPRLTSYSRKTILSTYDSFLSTVEITAKAVLFLLVIVPLVVLRVLLVPNSNGAKRKVLYGKTRAEARDKLAKALSDRIDGIVYDDENMTLGEYLDVWLEGSVYGSVRQSTYDRDTNLVNNHIKPVLGMLKLKKLNSTHVQSFYRDRLDEGLSASTVHKMHDILRRSLAQATQWHLVPRNVADTVTPPRPAPKEIKALSADEARRLLEAACEDRFEALYVLAVHTGMRRGELLGLKWA